MKKSSRLTVSVPVANVTVIVTVISAVVSKANVEIAVPVPVPKVNPGLCAIGGTIWIFVALRLLME